MWKMIGSFFTGMWGRIWKANDMPEKIIYDSAELACFHEAGHAVAALDAGARVVEMELYRDPVRSHGRTRCDRTEAQKPHIALGGFAVEYRLYQEGRLLKKDGNAPSQKEFMDTSIDNASDDRKSYFGGDFSKDGLWPAEMDKEFMSYAIGFADRMDFERVERIATALLEAGKLTEEEIVKL